MRINPDLDESNATEPNGSPSPAERSAILAERISKKLSASVSLSYLETPLKKLPKRFVVLDSETLSLFEATANPNCNA
jgi:hypothetical protein